MTCQHRPSPNPREPGCVKCGRPLPQMRPRDPVLERELTQMAAQAAGFLDTGGLDDFADRRAWPGGVRPDIDHDREAMEELADARHYLVWAIVPIWADYLRGEPWATKLVARRLSALGGVLVAWHALRS